MMRNSIACTLLVILAVPFAMGNIITESEIDGQAANNTLSTAQTILGGAFTLPLPPNVLGSPGPFPTATIQGHFYGPTVATADLDVDFYSFSAVSGSRVFFDIDNAPLTFPTFLSLFNAGGTLLAYDQALNSGADPGSAAFTDSFLGVFTLPNTGTYYIAVSAGGNFPDAFGLCSEFPNIQYLSVAGVAPNTCPAGLSTFSFRNAAQPVGALPYTLQISLESVVPEPSTVGFLIVGAIFLLVWKRAACTSLF